MGWFGGIEILSQDLGIPLDILKITIGFILILLLSNPKFKFRSSLPPAPLQNISELLEHCSRSPPSLLHYWRMVIFCIDGDLCALLPHSLIPSAVSDQCGLGQPSAHNSPQSPFYVIDLWVSVSYVEWKVDCSVYIMFLTTKLTYYGKWF